MNEELVLDAREVDWDHDVTLNRANLALSVAERIDRLVPYEKLVHELQAGARCLSSILAGSSRRLSRTPSSSC